MPSASIRESSGAPRYDGTSIILHWLTALLIFALFGLGWYMTDLPKGSEARTYFFALHKSIGLTAACVVLVRLTWRLRHPAPRLPDSLRAWQRTLAGAAHSLLYALLVAQPLSGYLSSSFTKYPTRWWGIPLPQWGWQDADLNTLFTDIHFACSIALLSLIALLKALTSP